MVLDGAALGLRATLVHVGQTGGQAEKKWFCQMMPFVYICFTHSDGLFLKDISDWFSVSTLASSIIKCPCITGSLLQLQE
jgi:hypothetical protein